MKDPSKLSNDQPSNSEISLAAQSLNVDYSFRIYTGSVDPLSPINAGFNSITNEILVSHLHGLSLFKYSKEINRISFPPEQNNVAHKIICLEDVGLWMLVRFPRKPRKPTVSLLNSRLKVFQSLEVDINCAVDAYYCESSHSLIIASSDGSFQQVLVDVQNSILTKANAPLKLVAHKDIGLHLSEHDYIIRACGFHENSIVIGIHESKLSVGYSFNEYDGIEKNSIDVIIPETQKFLINGKAMCATSSASHLCLGLKCGRVQIWLVSHIYNSDSESPLNLTYQFQAFPNSAVTSICIEQNCGKSLFHESNNSKTKSLSLFCGSADGTVHHYWISLQQNSDVHMLVGEHRCSCEPNFYPSFKLQAVSQIILTGSSLNNGEVNTKKMTSKLLVFVNGLVTIFSLCSPLWNISDTDKAENIICVETFHKNYGGFITMSNDGVICLFKNKRIEKVIYIEETSRVQIPCKEQIEQNEKNNNFSVPNLLMSSGGSDQCKLAGMLSCKPTCIVFDGSSMLWIGFNDGTVTAVEVHENKDTFCVPMTSAASTNPSVEAVTSSVEASISCLALLDKGLVASGDINGGLALWQPNRDHIGGTEIMWANKLLHGSSICGLAVEFDQYGKSTVLISVSTDGLIRISHLLPSSSTPKFLKRSGMHNLKSQAKYFLVPQASVPTGCSVVCSSAHTFKVGSEKDKNCTQASRISVLIGTALGRIEAWVSSFEDELVHPLLKGDSKNVHNARISSIVKADMHDDDGGFDSVFASFSLDNTVCIFTFCRDCSILVLHRLNISSLNILIRLPNVKCIALLPTSEGLELVIGGAKLYSTCINFVSKNAYISFLKESHQLDSTFSKNTDQSDCSSYASCSIASVVKSLHSLSCTNVDKISSNESLILNLKHNLPSINLNLGNTQHHSPNFKKPHALFHSRESHHRSYRNLKSKSERYEYNSMGERVRVSTDLSDLEGYECTKSGPSSGCFLGFSTPNIVTAKSVVKSRMAKSANILRRKISRFEHLPWFSNPVNADEQCSSESYGKIVPTKNLKLSSSGGLINVALEVLLLAERVGIRRLGQCLRTRYLQRFGLRETAEGYILDIWNATVEVQPGETGEWSLCFLKKLLGLHIEVNGIPNNRADKWCFTAAQSSLEIRAWLRKKKFFIDFVSDVHKSHDHSPHSWCSHVELCLRTHLSQWGYPLHSALSNATFELTKEKNVEMEDSILNVDWFLEKFTCAAEEVLASFFRAEEILFGDQAVDLLGNRRSVSREATNRLQVASDMLRDKTENADKISSLCTIRKLRPLLDKCIVCDSKRNGCISVSDFNRIAFNYWSDSILQSKISAQFTDMSSNGSVQIRYVDLWITLYHLGLEGNTDILDASGAYLACQNLGRGADALYWQALLTYISTSKNLTESEVTIEKLGVLNTAVSGGADQSIVSTKKNEFGLDTLVVAQVQLEGDIRDHHQQEKRLCTHKVENSALGSHGKKNISKFKPPYLFQCDISSTFYIDNHKCQYSNAKSSNSNSNKYGNSRFSFSRDIPLLYSSNESFSNCSFVSTNGNKLCTDTYDRKILYSQNCIDVDSIGASEENGIESLSKNVTDLEDDLYSISTNCVDPSFQKSNAHVQIGGYFNCNLKNKHNQNVKCLNKNDNNAREYSNIGIYDASGRPASPLVRCPSHCNLVKAKKKEQKAFKITEHKIFKKKKVKHLIVKKKSHEVIDNFENHQISEEDSINSASGESLHECEVSWQEEQEHTIENESNRSIESELSRHVSNESNCSISSKSSSPVSNRSVGSILNKSDVHTDNDSEVSSNTAIPIIITAPKEYVPILLNKSLSKKEAKTRDILYPTDYADEIDKLKAKLTIIYKEAAEKARIGSELKLMEMEDIRFEYSDEEMLCDQQQLNCSVLENILKSDIGECEEGGRTWWKYIMNQIPNNLFKRLKYAGNDPNLNEPLNEMSHDIAWGHFLKEVKNALLYTFELVILNNQVKHELKNLRQIHTSPIDNSSVPKREILHSTQIQNRTNIYGEVEKGIWKFYSLPEISKNARKIVVKVHTVDGNLDLYLKKGQFPDSNSYDSMMSTCADTISYLRYLPKIDEIIGNYYIGIFSARKVRFQLSVEIFNPDQDASALTLSGDNAIAKLSLLAEMDPKRLLRNFEAACLDADLQLKELDKAGDNVFDHVVPDQTHSSDSKTVSSISSPSCSNMVLDEQIRLVSGKKTLSRLPTLDKKFKSPLIRSRSDYLTTEIKSKAKLQKYTLSKLDKTWRHEIEHMQIFHNTKKEFPCKHPYN